MVRGDFFSSQHLKLTEDFKRTHTYLSDDIHIRNHIEHVLDAVDQQNAGLLKVLLDKEIPISIHYSSDGQMKPVLDFKSALQYALLHAAKQGNQPIVDIISNSSIQVNKCVSQCARQLAGKLDPVYIEAASSLLRSSVVTPGGADAEGLNAAAP